MQIRQASTDNEIAIARILFQEYAAWLGVDLAFQGFGAELVGLPGVYSPPRGRLLLASEKGETAGCIALRSLTELACEMKRLFVSQRFTDAGSARCWPKELLGKRK
jgi:carbonic anhydrase